eukprot:2293241-Karenia_brevis.AAC.1
MDMPLQFEDEETTGTQSAFVPSGNKSTKAAAGSAQNPQCRICFAPAVGKQAFCKGCEEDVHHAKKQAIEQGKQDCNICIVIH